MLDYFSNVEPVSSVLKLLTEKPEEWEEVGFDDGGIYSGVMHTSGMLLQWSSYLGEVWFWKNLGHCEPIDKIHHSVLMEAIFEMMVSKINKSCDPPVKIIKLAEDVKSGQVEKAKMLADEIVKYFDPITLH